jgi:hypothetical protein
LNKLIEKRTIGLDATQIHDHFKPKRIAVRLKLAEKNNFKVLDVLFPFFLPKLRTETFDRTLSLLKHLTEKIKLIEKKNFRRPFALSLLLKLKVQKSDRVKKKEKKRERE